MKDIREYARKYCKRGSFIVKRVAWSCHFALHKWGKTGVKRGSGFTLLSPRAFDRCTLGRGRKQLGLGEKLYGVKTTCKETRFGAYCKKVAREPVALCVLKSHHCGVIPDATSKT